MEIGTYIKTGTTFIVIEVNLDLILIQIYRKNKGKKGIETVYRNMRRKRNKKTFLKCESNQYNLSLSLPCDTLRSRVKRNSELK